MFRFFTVNEYKNDAASDDKNHYARFHLSPVCGGEGRDLAVQV